MTAHQFGMAAFLHLNSLENLMQMSLGRCMSLVPNSPSDQLTSDPHKLNNIGSTIVEHV